MVAVTEESLRQLVEAIVREVDPEEVWLFGSRARGQAGEHSDIDLMVVQRDPFAERGRRWRQLSRLYDIASQRRLPVDILVYSREEVDRLGNRAGHILGTVLAGGRRLYERS